MLKYTPQAVPDPGTYYPKGIEPKEPRPLVTWEQDPPRSLESCIRWWFDQQERQRFEFCRLYSRGPYVRSVLFFDRDLDSYETVESGTHKAEGWTDETLEDWHYGELTSKLAERYATPVTESTERLVDDDCPSVCPGDGGGGAQDG